MPARHVVVDGSNIATEGNSLPTLKQLDEAVREFLRENPDDIITVVVDATFGHRIPPEERDRFEQAELEADVVSPPAGAIGRGDAFLLRVADKVGAVVLSNDSFQEFHGEYEWLFDKGRLIGGKPVPGVGSIFTPRSPVRGPKSRESVKEAKRKRRPDQPEEAESGLELVGPRSRTRGGERKLQRAIAVAVEEAVEPEKADHKRRRRRRGGEMPADPLNEPFSFISFIAAHQLGDEVEGTVEEFSSHGAFISVGNARCYVPLSAMGDVPPRSAREVLRKGEKRAFVVQAFDAMRRGIELAMPGFAHPAGTPTPETIDAEIHHGVEVAGAAAGTAPARSRTRSRSQSSRPRVAPLGAGGPLMPAEHHETPVVAAADSVLTTEAVGAANGSGAPGRSGGRSRRRHKAVSQSSLDGIAGVVDDAAPPVKSPTARKATGAARAGTAAKATAPSRARAATNGAGATKAVTSGKATAATASKASAPTRAATADGTAETASAKKARAVTKAAGAKRSQASKKPAATRRTAPMRSAPTESAPSERTTARQPKAARAITPAPEARVGRSRTVPQKATVPTKRGSAAANAAKAAVAGEAAAPAKVAVARTAARRTGKAAAGKAAAGKAAAGKAAAGKAAAGKAAAGKAAAPGKLAAGAKGAPAGKTAPAKTAAPGKAAAAGKAPAAAGKAATAGKAPGTAGKAPGTAGEAPGTAGKTPGTAGKTPAAGKAATAGGVGKATVAANAAKAAPGQKTALAQEPPSVTRAPARRPQAAPAAVAPPATTRGVGAASPAQAAPRAAKAASDSGARRPAKIEPSSPPAPVRRARGQGAPAKGSQEGQPATSTAAGRAGRAQASEAVLLPESM